MQNYFLNILNLFFFLIDPVEKVTLSSSNLERTIAYWKDILGLQIFDRKDKNVLMGYSKDQAKLEFEDIGEHVIFNLFLSNL